MACTSCYKIKIDNCAESVTVAGELIPDTNYTWVITDKFGHEWSYVVTTDENGSFTIDLTDPMFPAGLFNQFSNLTLEVFLYETQCEAAEMTFCDEPYTCVNFSVNPGNYVYTPPPPPDEVMTCCFEDILYDDIQALILNDEITEGMMYRITDATEYEINLIVTGLSTSAVTGEAYSQEFPQDEIFYDIANDVITRRTDTIKKLSAPFDWRNKRQTLYRRKYDGESIGYPCTPIRYTYGGSPIDAALPDATTAGMVFNDSSDLLNWLVSVYGGTGVFGVKEDGTAYQLTTYSLGAYDVNYTAFTVNDGTNKTIGFTDDDVEFYTFGNNIVGSSGANTDLVTSAVNGNGGTCFNIYINDTSTASTVVIGDACFDIRFGFGVLANGAANVQISSETGGTVLYSSASAISNVTSFIGGINGNSEYGGISYNIINNTSASGVNVLGFSSINVGNESLTQTTTTERTDSALGMYDYRVGQSLAISSKVSVPFTQTVDKIWMSSTVASGFDGIIRILIPTAGNTLTLTATAVGALANAGEIICEDGTITLDGSNFDYAVLESFSISGTLYWRVKEYHNY